MRFGDRVKKDRLKLGLIQTAVGSSMGVSGVYITQIEKNQKLPSPKVTVLLAKALKVDPVIYLHLVTQAQCELIKVKYKTKERG